MGEVHEGSAVTDWMDQERQRGITITSAAISCNWTNASGPYSLHPSYLDIGILSIMIDERSSMTIRT